MRSLLLLAQQQQAPAEAIGLLTRLLDISLNLRWTWSHTGDSFWYTLDPEIWEQTNNPNTIIENLSFNKLQELATNDEFMRRLQELDEANEKYYEAKTWGQAMQLKERLGCVAYFSMEFGIGVALPLYAGGLGILAGDYLKAASDRDVPMVGVSLLYQEGYFRQMIDANGWQQEVYAHNDSLSIPARPVLSKEGGWLHVDVELPGRTVYLRVWQAQVGRVALYLLDSNIGRNSASDQGITSQLYGGTDELRLMQEIVLGVGGWRVLEALELDVSICHLNEGHAAFAALERAYWYMKKHDMSLPEALWTTRPSNVFTTHTPVDGAFDRFHRDLLMQYGRTLFSESHLDHHVDAMWELGQRPDHGDPDHFNMTYLALRTCGVANGVSELHGEVSRKLFKPLYPDWPTSEVPITYVTNGIHVASWESRWADKVWDKACGKERWRVEVEDVTQSIMNISDEEVWNLCGEGRADLVHNARSRLHRQLGARGADADTLKHAENVLDPNILTLGMARRFTQYKRNNLLLADPDRLARLLKNTRRPVQIVVAGKAHPRDELGKGMLQEWARFVERPEVAGKVVLLTDYDIELGRDMVQGVDLWVNTPRRPWEACGTSGMKVLVNGGLNLSTVDGWWAEAYSSDFGWAVGDDQDLPEAEQDARDAEQTYRLLEEEIVPMFYDRDSAGVPREWVRRVRASMAVLTPQFSANRMLRDYTEKLYLPCVEAFKERSANNAELGRRMPEWFAMLTDHWDQLHWGQLSYERSGKAMIISVQLYLGDITDDAVEVQLFADATGGEPLISQPMTRSAEIPGAVNGHVYQVELTTRRSPSDFTPRVVPYFPTANMPLELPLISWWSGEAIKEVKKSG